jgi:16S rRNA (cytidine1402-2'-O)-methyltransferase
MLYLVATPIGNLGDLSQRALETLRAVSVIAAEDTRVTRKILFHFEIKTPLISYHEHSGPVATGALVQRMTERGESVALVTDAGTPGISDPGAELVAAAIAAGVMVVPIPGPAAFVVALVGSGLPSARFAFEGFLPRTRGPRLERLQSLRPMPRTLLFYESPHRLAGTLREMASEIGADRPACVARELTKKFEEFRRGSLAELAAFYAETAVRGECVIVVGGASADDEAVTLEQTADGEAPPRANDLIKLLAQETGVSRRDLYRAIADLKNQAS